MRKFALKASGFHGNRVFFTGEIRADKSVKSLI